MKSLLSTVLLLTAALYLPATVAEQTPYRSPEDFTTAERQAMVSGMSDYSLCLRDEALTIIGKYQDVRQIADIAMTRCQRVLDTLDAMMTENRLSPEFRKSYITRGRNRSAKVMLPEIMQLKASGY